MPSRPSVKVFSYPDNNYRKIHSRGKKREQAAKKRRHPQEGKANHSGKKSYKIRPVSENPEISARYSRSYRNLETNLEMIEKEREWFRWQKSWEEWEEWEDMMEYYDWTSKKTEQAELEQQEWQRQQDIEDKERKEAEKRQEAAAIKLQQKKDADMAHQKQTIIKAITSLLTEANTYHYYQYNKGGRIEIRLEY